MGGGIFEERALRCLFAGERLPLQLRSRQLFAPCRKPRRKIHDAISVGGSP